jgi:hypothetical protein
MFNPRLCQKSKKVEFRLIFVGFLLDWIELQKLTKIQQIIFFYIFDIKHGLNSQL